MSVESEVVFDGRVVGRGMVVCFSGGGEDEDDYVYVYDAYDCVHGSLKSRQVLAGVEKIVNLGVCQT